MPLLVVAYVAFALLLAALSVLGIVHAGRGRPISRRTARIALGAWLIALVLMTLRPAGSTERLNLIPDLGGAAFSAFDTIANMAVFLPLGLILAASRHTIWKSLAIGLVVSLGVETAQFIIDAGRAADINDVITNVAGTAVGWGVAWAINRARAPRPLTTEPQP